MSTDDYWILSDWRSRYLTDSERAAGLKHTQEHLAAAPPEVVIEIRGKRLWFAGCECEYCQLAADMAYAGWD